MTKFAYEEITEAIIGAYFDVYNLTSRTYPEYIYERAMIEELRLRDIPVTQQDEYEITYKGQFVGKQRLDLFVVDEVVVENKVADQITRLHKAQTISYLKTVDKPVGLLLNFGCEKPKFSRLYFNPAKRPYALSQDRLQKARAQSADLLYPDLCFDVVGGLYEVHSTLGAGFVHRIYGNACWRELRLRGLDARPGRRMQVAYKGIVIGDVAFRHIIVEGKVMLFPVAIRDVSDIHLDDLKRWMQLCGVELGILANFDAIRLNPKFIRVREEQDIEN